MGCTVSGYPKVTDHGVGNRRDENLHAQLLIPTGRSLRLAAADAVQSHACRNRCDAVGGSAGSGR